MKLSEADLLFYDVNNVPLFLDGGEISKRGPWGEKRAGVQSLGGAVTDRWTDTHLSTQLEPLVWMEAPSPSSTLST